MAKGKYWRDAPQEHDYPAAADYLSLLFSDAEVAEMVDRLRAAPAALRKAKDLLRSSGLVLLPATDPEVAKDLKKVKEGELVSPVLLVRTGGGKPLIVADGYHRICAGYHLDEDAEIDCRIATWP